MDDRQGGMKYGRALRVMAWAIYVLVLVDIGAPLVAYIVHDARGPLGILLAILGVILYVVGMLLLWGMFYLGTRRFK